MRNTQHTPGPWHTSREMLYDVWADAPTAEHPRAIFKILQQTRGRTDAEIEANARLIAVAPEMYAFISAIAQRPCSCHQEMTCQGCAARALIAKVEEQS